MSKLLSMKDMTSQQMAMVQAESKSEKLKGIAYALWFFTGGLGGHK